MIRNTHTHTHTHPFNGPFSGNTRVSRYQKSKTNLDFTEARDSEWQWYQLGHMQVCTSLQTDNHTGTPPLFFFTDQMPFLPPNQQHQSTEGKHTSTWCKFSVASICLIWFVWKSIYLFEAPWSSHWTLLLGTAYQFCYLLTYYLVGDVIPSLGVESCDSVAYCLGHVSFML